MFRNAQRIQVKILDASDGAMLRVQGIVGEDRTRVNGCLIAGALSVRSDRQVMIPDALMKTGTACT
jgi:hypothetical protein